MTITRHKDSHLDHALTQEQIKFILNLDAREIQTIQLPEHLGLVPCGLHGPLMGDEPVPESEVTYAVRGERRGKSRLVDRIVRTTRMVTVIAGPHDGLPCVLFTAFGGPLTPKEPFDFDYHESEEAQVSRRFWEQHALSL